RNTRAVTSFRTSLCVRRWCVWPRILPNVNERERQTRLLRGLGRRQGSRRAGDQERLSQEGDAAPSGPQSRQSQGIRREIQGSGGGLRRPQRSGKTLCV